MRRRTSGISDDASDSSDSETNIQASHPNEGLILFKKKLPSFAIVSDQQRDPLQRLFVHIVEGKLLWAKCLSIFVAATLTYTYKNASTPSKQNVQIAIMTIITLVGATPLSAHIIPASIGAFVGGQNIIGSTGLMEDNTQIRPINYVWLFLLSIVVGICFQFFCDKKILDGYAGRLGTTTFVGMNIVMLTIYGPLGIVDWDRYYYGFNHVIHMAEEDSTLDFATAWTWLEASETAIGYVLAVLWLGWVSGVTRILHNEYIQKCNQENKDDQEAQKQATSPPVPLNNVVVPVLWALLSMLLINATEYKHASGLYNGFAVGSYVGMASLQKIPSITRFLVVSLIAALWGLFLTPFFVGFAGKSGFTAMLGHVTFVWIDSVLEKIRGDRLKQQQQMIEKEEANAERQQRQDQEQSLMVDKKDNERDEEDPLTLRPELNVTGKYIKPKEPFLTKQQRRQQQRMKHLQQKQQRNETMPNEAPNSPRLHHRAWTAVPGDDPWKHPMEDDPNYQSSTTEQHNVVWM